MQGQQLRIAWPRATRNFLIIAAALTLAWVAQLFITPLREQLIPQTLALTPTSFPELELWAVLTHALCSNNLLDVLFQLLILYLTAETLERVWSGKKWWGTLLAATVVPGALVGLWGWGVGMSAPFVGIAAPVSAFFAAYCWQSWNRPLYLFTIEIQGKKLLAGFLLLDVLLGLFGAGPVYVIARLSGAGIGLLSAMNLGTLKDIRLRYHSWRVRRNMRIVARNPEAKVGPRRRTDDGEWIN